MVLSNKYNAWSYFLCLHPKYRFLSTFSEFLAALPQHCCGLEYLAWLQLLNQQDKLRSEGLPG